MNFTIYFVSLNEAWIEYIKIYFKNVDCKIINDNIQNIDTKNTIFVSPANSLGFMDGGIDRIYNEIIFPECRVQLQNILETLPYRTFLGRPYLPVGSAVIVNREKEESGIIFAPTMFKPSDVSKTQNAYNSFLAALYLMKKYNLKIKIPFSRLVVTSHCCGYGMMDEEESVKQMYTAYCDFNNDSMPDIIYSENLSDRILLPLVDDENPFTY